MWLHANIKPFNIRDFTIQWFWYLRVSWNQPPNYNYTEFNLCQANSGSHLRPSGAHCLSTSERTPTFSCPEKPQRSVWSSRKGSYLHLEMSLQLWTTFVGTLDTSVAVVVWNRHGWELKDQLTFTPLDPSQSQNGGETSSLLANLNPGKVVDPENVITG